MQTAKLLGDAFGRIGGMVHGAVEHLSDDDLAYRVDADANSIAWLVWHLSRIQDDHVAAVARTEQVWIAQGWLDRFALPLAPSDHGYGHSSQQVASVRASAELLTGYYDAVARATSEYLEGLADEDLDRIVDTRFDPPVTLGVRLVSVICDDVAHVGQAAFIRGLLERR